MTLVPRVLLSATLAGPAPSGSTDTSRLCRGCSHPPRRFPDQAAPSFAALLRQGQRWMVSHLHPTQQRLTAHEDQCPGWRVAPSRQPRKAAELRLGRCHHAAGQAAGPGGAPAAKRGRTTWRRGETTATPGHEEGQGPKIAVKPQCPKGTSHAAKRTDGTP